MISSDDGKWNNPEPAFKNSKNATEAQFSPKTATSHNTVM